MGPFHWPLPSLKGADFVGCSQWCHDGFIRTLNQGHTRDRIDVLWSYTYPASHPVRILAFPAPALPQCEVYVESGLRRSAMIHSTPVTKGLWYGPLIWIPYLYPLYIPHADYGSMA